LQFSERLMMVRFMQVFESNGNTRQMRVKITSGGKLSNHEPIGQLLMFTQFAGKVRVREI